MLHAFHCLLQSYPCIPRPMLDVVSRPERPGQLSLPWSHASPQESASSANFRHTQTDLSGAWASLDAPTHVISPLASHQTFLSQAMASGKEGKVRESILFALAGAWQAQGTLPDVPCLCWYRVTRHKIASCRRSATWKNSVQFQCVCFCTMSLFSPIYSKAQHATVWKYFAAARMLAHFSHRSHFG